MNVPLYIAKRYFITRKSRRAIGIISAISAAGIAVGTAALLIILSVFNGFDQLIQDSLSAIDPDLKVTPASGKAILPDDPAFSEACDWLAGESCVSAVSGIIEEQVYLHCGGRQALVLARGGDAAYLAGSPLKRQSVSGTAFWQDSLPRLMIGQQLAAQLGDYGYLPPECELYYPSRKRPVSLQNPAASLQKERCLIETLFQSGSEYDSRLVLAPISVMRTLLEYEDGEISALEVRFVPGTSAREQEHLARALGSRLGPAYTVRDRVAQNEALFKMMKYEKGAIFLILLAVVLIVAFNIFGSLSMLILEKKDDIATLESLGGGKPLIRRIFFWEGALVSLSGAAIGLLLGIGITLLQQHVGLVRMPEVFSIRYYPVVLRAREILLTGVAVTAIGLVIAFLASRNVHPKTNS